MTLPVPRKPGRGTRQHFVREVEISSAAWNNYFLEFGVRYGAHHIVAFHWLIWQKASEDSDGWVKYVHRIIALIGRYGF